MLALILAMAFAGEPGEGDGSRFADRLMVDEARRIEDFLGARLGLQ